MDSQDDPEQRIRDLEPPPAQPWVDTGSRRPGMRVGWIVLVLLVLGLVIGGGLMIAERMATPGRPIATRPTEPTVAGGGGSFAPAPRPAGAELTVAGIDQAETHVCDATVVNISGVHNRIVLTGHCTRVDISGVRNTVIITEADAIIVSGLDNTVTFQIGSPEVSQSGFDNSVARG